MRRVRVSRDAQRDLDEIWLYIARDSADAADHFIDQLKVRFILIRTSPEMGRSSRFRIRLPQIMALHLRRLLLAQHAQ
jgi:plasmid stabilization system protein ParE